ncbi:MAG: LytR/AlgR family response regulator transcription factor [Brevundimonas sp.]
MTVSCLIIEDQMPAQRILARYIGDLPDLELVGTCGNALEAMKFLQRQKIDLMLLDLNLPRLGGFDFLRSLTAPPRVIVTSAYPEHAVEGFDLNVVDYLVKPFAFDRFIRAVDRVRAVDKPALAAAPASAAREIFVRVDGDLRRVALDEIAFLRADGDYVSIQCKAGRLFVSGPLRRWEEKLPPEWFVRTHRSYIVNLTHVNTVAGSRIVMADGVAQIGRRFRDGFISQLNRSTATLGRQA